MLPQPFLRVLSFLNQFLHARPVHNTLLAPVTFAVQMRKSQKVEGFFRPFITVKRKNPAFVVRDFQTMFFLSFNRSTTTSSGGLNNGLTRARLLVTTISGTQPPSLLPAAFYKMLYLLSSNLSISSWFLIHSRIVSSLAFPIVVT